MGKYLDKLNTVCDSSDESLSRAFQEVMERLAQAYQLGTLSLIKERHPRLYAMTQHIEIQLNNAWIAVRDRGQDATGFFVLLEQWDHLMQEWIERAAEKA